MKKTKKGQPLTRMGRLKLRKLRARGRARDWHKSRRALRDRRAHVAAWFERQVGKMLGEVFSHENLRRAAPMAAVGDVRVRVRGIKR